MTDRQILDDIAVNHGGIMSLRRIRKQYNVGYGRARRIAQQLNGSGSGVDVSLGEETGTVNYTGPVRNVDELLRAANVDTTNWKVASQRIRVWDSNTKDGVRQFFHVSASLVRSKVDMLAEALQGLDIPPYRPSGNVEYKRGDSLLVISLADMHFGKYSWKRETGANYDVDIASKLYLGAVEYLLAQAQKLTSVDRVLYIVGNDLLHVDSGFDNTTTKGTPQDTDGRWQKAFRAALQATILGIEMAAKVAPVDVLIQPGNHDWEKAQVLGVALEMRYADAEHITVANDERPRHYYKHGKTLIGIMHGHDIKAQAMPLVMSEEAGELWCGTKYHEILIGHFHKKRETVYVPLVEYGGVRVRVLPSLSAPDRWHSEKGFGTSQRASEALLYSSDHGYMATLSYNI